VAFGKQHFDHEKIFSFFGGGACEIFKVKNYEWNKKGKAWMDKVRRKNEREEREEGIL
jgi:hypothetical protein